MKSTEFCYWLQGFFEISRASDTTLLNSGLTGAQAKMIEDHLKLVFIHEIDPSYPTEQQDALNTAHNGIKPSAMRC